MTGCFETIVFDLGNTLIKFDHNISSGKIAHRFGLDPAKTFDMLFHTRYIQELETGTISPQVFYRKTIDGLGIDITYSEFVDIWNDIFWEDKEACAIARSLKNRYKLFLLSNVSSLHFDYIKNKYDIISIFDETILSFKVGAMKPDNKIFKIVIDRSGGDVSRILYIDDREDLVASARGIGIDSIRFENAEQLLGEMRKRGVKAT